MFTLTPEATYSEIHVMPNTRAIEVREPGGTLFRTITAHQVDCLLDKKMVEGISNKGGFKYLRLTKPRKDAARVLDRTFGRAGRIVAEDNTTVTRELKTTWCHTHTAMWNPTRRLDAGLAYSRSV